MTRYRGRFAPSPTGPLHFGSLVAAAGSFLEARTRGGAWLVRMEDLDPPRVAPGAAEEILQTLRACGMEWDGVVVNQSARSDAYHSALHRLREMKRVYPCACSRREIADSAVAGIDGPVYPGTCRAGLPPGKSARALRIDTRGANIAFDDALQGHIAHDLERGLGDFLVYRMEDVYAYQLAVVVDDAEQGITDVVRGADLLGSTPWQIYLQQLLGLPQPRYAHLPVAVDEAGEKLSKQTFAMPLDAGNPQPALAAALDFLGQKPPRELARATIKELWDWALKNWRLDWVPRRLSAPANSSESWVVGGGS
jgi:glutamyl-Q tRNA(Asp) synthetase